VIFERQARSGTFASRRAGACCATGTWTGTTSGNWRDASNWGGTLPSAQHHDRVRLGESLSES